MDACYDYAFDDQHRKQCYEDDEVFVVSFANTCSEPRAMMVKSLNAAVADSTMHSSWRPIDITGATVLNFGQSCIYYIQILLSNLL